MSPKRDYYAVLGVGRDAGLPEIKSAYRKLALQYHPDRNPEKAEEATERFKEITEAYSVLADAEKRAVYDRFGHAGVGASAPDFSSTIFSDFEDIFGDFFGFGDIFGQRRGRRSRAERGADLRYDMEISFEEAATGLDTKIKIPRWESCAECGGRGARKGSEAVTCATCGGRGQIRRQQGFFTVTRTCPNCQGLGQVIVEPCPACKGEGRALKEKVLGIKIPAGVDDGTRLRVSGEGEAGYFGGPPGDLYVVLRVHEHSFFERRGNDLYCTVPISVTQAVLGTEINAPTLSGQERLHIPEGTQPGSVFRIRGKGFPSLDRGGQGDLYVTVEIVIPSHLTREQRRLFEMLSGTTHVENKPLHRRVSEKVKSIFG
ncbi:MAG: molecular chaperone DnaJ [Acidobacteria bacterium]|nr:MAG: molecular chaperone DnaJ [Acidobacteriota bacterium]